MFKSKKIDKCDIQLENERLVFYPGETLKGKFILEMNRSMKMNSISVVCKGKMKTEWERTVVDSEGESKTYEYESKKKLFEDKKKIFGGGDDKHEHDAGRKEYPFEFQIPDKVPTSFHSELGFIQYSLKVIVKKSWKKDLKLKKMFIVNSVIDANKESYCVAPGDEDQKMLGCLCCASGPITLSCNLNRSCFCPGDSILVTAKVENNTDRDMDELEAELIQVIKYEADLKGGFGEEDRSTSIKVAELESKKIKGGDTLEWNAKAMPLPPMPPTMDSKLIDIKYFVKVHLDIPMGIDMDFKLPVTIGTVPCKATYQDSPATRSDKFKPKAPKGIGPPDVEFLGHPDLLPFQYSQVLKDKPKKMNKKDDKEFDDDYYIPLYTWAEPFKGKKGSRPTSAEEADASKSLPPIE